MALVRLEPMVPGLWYAIKGADDLKDRSRLQFEFVGWSRKKVTDQGGSGLDVGLRDITQVYRKGFPLLVLQGCRECQDNPLADSLYSRRPAQDQILPLIVVGLYNLSLLKGTEK
jgi:hypothetical protein